MSSLRTDDKPRHAPTAVQKALDLMREAAVQVSQKLPKACPGCGHVERLYRTPRGLRCESCVRVMDSSGLGFR